MPKLSEYERKRDPKQTPEPFGSKKKGKAPIFVVQRHDARRLHYDFRLERNGALASWAVPKGVPLDPGEQRLAVHVEDHPLDYATFEGEIPKGAGWLFEVKWDGYRALAYVHAGEARLVSRNGNDLTARFPTVARAAAQAVKSPDCVLDGEVCALDEQGRSSFSAMQQAKPGTPIVYYVFDVLEVDGKPLVDLPLTERRKRLEQLLDKRNRTVRPSESFDDGNALLQAAKEQQLEGIIAKRLDSRYAIG